MGERLTVAAFGSCRVISPVTMLHRRNRLTFVNHDQRWYTHTAAEALQKISILTGRYEVPAGIAPLLIDVDSIGATDPNAVLNAEFTPDYFDGADIAVFELSTRRVFDLDGVYLHATAVQKFRGAASNAPERRLLEQAREYYIEFETLERDVKQLAALFPRIVLYLTIERGDDLSKGGHAGRKALNAFLTGLADGKTIFAFDPNTWIDQVGTKNALIDSNHFTDTYSEFLSKKLSEKLQQIVEPTSSGTADAEPPAGA